jgi:predicted O-methyltransferase YrrM
VHGLSDTVQLITTPLVSQENNLPWYDVAQVQQAMGNRSFDMVIVDGPSAKYGATVREPALPLLKQQLADNSIVFLDDTRREGEAAILLTWKKQLEALGKSPKLHWHRVYGTITCGHHFSATPISH